MKRKLEKALKLLNELDYGIRRREDGTFYQNDCCGGFLELTEREVLKYARNVHHTWDSKRVKREAGGINRTATRELIQSEQFDKMPSHGLIKQNDNPYYW